MITKESIALQYEPYITPRSALRKLRKQIATVPGLRQALLEAGYSPQAHSLTPRQVEILYHYLGKP